MAQWVENLTAVARVTVEAPVRSLAQELLNAASAAIKKKKKKSDVNRMELFPEEDSLRYTPT